MTIYCEYSEFYIKRILGIGKQSYGSFNILYRGDILKNQKTLKEEDFLSEISPGDTAIIYSIDRSEIQHRMYDLGLVPGTQVECIASAPLGGPSAYLVRGAVIALRINDARLIKIKQNLKGGEE